MEQTPGAFLMVFLLPFHLGGGAALGVALRGIVQNGFNLSGIARNGFLLLWGSLFGGLPLLFGLAQGTLWFVLLELLVFAGTIVLVAVAFDWLRDLYSQPGMFVASFGFVFFLVGAALVTFILGADSSDGLVIGLIFAGVGGLLTLLGVGMLLRTG